MKSQKVVSGQAASQQACSLASSLHTQLRVQSQLAGLFSYIGTSDWLWRRFSGVERSENIGCHTTVCGEAVWYLFEKGTSELTVILLLLLSMDTTPPPRFPALPLTLMRSCRNCSCRGNQQAFLTNIQLQHPEEGGENGALLKNVCDHLRSCG